MLGFVRELVVIDMLKQELEDVYNPNLVAEFLSEQHIKLLVQSLEHYKKVNTKINELSEYDFSQSISQLDFEYPFESKKLLSIHQHLLDWTIDFNVAKRKAEDILTKEFDQQAERRLDLWQSKAAKAKKQIRTLAAALEQQQYVAFTEHFKLQNTELSWQNIKP